MMVRGWGRGGGRREGRGGGSGWGRGGGGSVIGSESRRGEGKSFSFSRESRVGKAGRR